MESPLAIRWSNPSISAFAAGDDPVEKMVKTALRAALEAIQDGWQGPPFDPFRLAEYRGIKVVPRDDISDARTVPVGAERLQIEYNPNRPIQRIRYSIAHEIAHTFFPDCAERVRHRAAATESVPVERELEMLCNLGAAELLMPTGSFPDLKAKLLTIEGLLELRKQYQVSAESVSLRYVNMTEQPIAVFVASRKQNSPQGRYQVDYAFGSRTWPIRMRKGLLLPDGTVVQKCTAIGSTAKGQEKWALSTEHVNVECVGLPPYSGSIYPRVLGIMHPLAGNIQPAPKIQYVVGDALRPTGTGRKILAHVVNDKTPNWGAGFGLAVRDAWPPVQDDFRSWSLNDPTRLHLGNIFISRISDEFFVSPMICQHGYGPSQRPRLRYAALKVCLEQLLAKATELKASVHMPRIGSGYAGGTWGLIEQLVDENLCRYGVHVTVYDLPGAKTPPEQRSLFA
jgi:Zn-dependent peptidase ImmA (M78 family)/O-acetyl-ADP-ribose deacetylase (regulator of RNase III)